MVMGVRHARHDDPPPSADHLAGRDGATGHRAGRDDPALVERDIAVGEDAPLRVHRHHIGLADQRIDPLGLHRPGLISPPPPGAAASRGPCRRTPSTPRLRVPPYPAPPPTTEPPPAG